MCPATSLMGTQKGEFTIGQFYGFVGECDDPRILNREGEFTARSEMKVAENYLSGPEQRYIFLLWFFYPYDEFC